jgi:hypothetical protein
LACSPGDDEVTGRFFGTGSSMSLHASSATSKLRPFGRALGRDLISEQYTSNHILFLVLLNLSLQFLPRWFPASINNHARLSLDLRPLLEGIESPNDERVDVKALEFGG